jgi:prevent-host-death family protein
MKKAALAEVKDHLSEYLNDAADEAVIITKHGRPAGVLIGFADEDDWLDYRLENDPAFLARIAQARASLRAGRGVDWEMVQAEDDRKAAGIEMISDRPRRAKTSRRRRA